MDRWTQKSGIQANLSMGSQDSLNWLQIARMTLIMAALLIHVQAGCSDAANATHQTNESLSSSDISVPAGFETEMEKAQYFEALSQRDPAAIEELIGVHERILARLPPGEYLAFRADIENRLGDAYLNRIQGDRAENIEMAIQHYNNSLQIWTRDAYPIMWAKVENNLGGAYRGRIRGDRANNIEIAIRHFNSSLQIWTHDAYPISWATIGNNLGAAYIDRIRGDRADNIEIAIRYFNSSLQVLTPDAYPAMWGSTEYNLGSAYQRRIRGDKAENIEMAIQHFNNSLQVLTREADPLGWASTENNLGGAYHYRIRGDKAENIEMAIQHYNNTLQVYTHESYPFNWANAQNNLGGAYRDRVRGDKAENIEIAIEHYGNSLQVWTRDADPIMWAMVENNLAAAYNLRIRADRAENIEMAIYHYNNSLQVWTRDADPIMWATVENNLGKAYWDRIRGNRAENIEMAIQHYNNSLQVRTREADPVMWAFTEENLGLAYWNRIQADRAQNIEMAIQHFNNSLQVRTRDADSYSWAWTENSLGLAYSDRILGNKVENIEIAIKHYQEALQIITLSSEPRDFRIIEGNLAGSYFEVGRWREALETYRKAIEAGDLLYRAGLSAESKSGEIKEGSEHYRNAAFAAVRLNEADEALRILEQGKTRLMREALRLRAKQPYRVPNDVWDKYNQSSEAYRMLQATPTPQEASVQSQSERERRSQEALIALDSAIEIVKEYEPGFQKDPEIPDIQNMLDNETALLSFCLTHKGSIVFVVTRSGGVKPVEVPGFTSTDLDQLVIERDNQGDITGGWIGNMSDSTREVMQATMDKVLIELSRKLLQPAVAEIPEDIKNIILLPSGSLFLLPIHAAPLSGSQELLCDRYVVSYAPSVELLMEMRTKAKERRGENLYAVINPTGDLDFTICEGERIARLFPDSRVDEGSSCTLASVLNGTRGQAYLHFASHGGYNWNDPTQSALILYNESLLTLADLQENDSLLLSSRLVTLSACETGITDVLVGSPEEYVGLPAGFMLSGAPCVVSSLWSVDDASTSMLMERFYSNYITKSMDIPSALQEAQQWVRGLTYLEVANYVIECRSTTKTSQRNDNLRSSGQVQNAASSAIEEQNAAPFSHPYYWAGFTVNGA